MRSMYLCGREWERESACMLRHGQVYLGANYCTGVWIFTCGWKMATQSADVLFFNSGRIKWWKTKKKHQTICHFHKYTIKTFRIHIKLNFLCYKLSCRICVSNVHCKLVTIYIMLPYLFWAHVFRIDSGKINIYFCSVKMWHFSCYTWY